MTSWRAHKWKKYKIYDNGDGVVFVDDDFGKGKIQI